MSRILHGLALLLVALSGVARAHERGVSYALWRLGDHGGDVELRIADRELDRLGGSDDPAAWAAGGVRLFAGDAPCVAASAPTAQDAAVGWTVLAWRVACAAPPDAVDAGVLLAPSPSHLHLVRVVDAAGAVREHALTAAEPRWSLAGAAAESTPAHDLLGWVRLGLWHVGSGWDHLAFLAGLVLLARSVREVAVLVSAFTVAHALTLALAALGTVRPDARAVETLIGFSIALVGVEDAWLLGRRGAAVPVAATLAPAAMAFGPSGALVPATLAGLSTFVACHFALLARVLEPARARAAVAFAFGLVHGFGFAGALGVLDLPVARLVPALLGFNLGVELAQLLAVALTWPLLRLATRRLGPVVTQAGAAAVCALGMYAFVARAYG